MVHVGDAVTQGFHEILHETVDTDVVVFAVAVCIIWLRQNRQNSGLPLVVERILGTFQSIRCVIQSVHKDLWHFLCVMLTQVVIQCPILFKLERRLHRKSGRRDEFTTTYYQLHNAREQIAGVLPYDMTATGSSINEVRKNLFIHNHKGRQMSGLPPTNAAHSNM